MDADETPEECIGPFGYSKSNKKGRNVLDLIRSNDYSASNMSFKHRFGTTWKDLSRR